MSEVSFFGLGVQPELVAGLAHMGIIRPTPVQVAVLQADNPTGDLIVQARTGSGKTLAFGLTFLSRLNAREASPQALVITPTRELAQQVCQALRPLAHALGIKTETLVGGGDMGGQLRGLRSGAQLLIGTPGRIVDHLNRGSLKTEQLQTVVLDEGDQMLDLGFKEELETILNALPEGRRTLLFSATMPEEMRRIAGRYMRETQTITLEGTDVQHADIAHVAYRIPRAQKLEALVNVLRHVASDRTMLFCRTRAETEEICRRLTAEGFSVGFLHGELEQRERNRVLLAFRQGKLSLLVATEVAARGIDVPGVTHVVNVDLPFNLEAYVHRSGRTGRAGQKGSCFNLVTFRDLRMFRRMLEQGNIKLEWRDVPTPDQIRDAGLKRLKQELETQLATATPERDALAIAKHLLDERDAVTVLAQLLCDRFTDDRLSGYDLAAQAQAEWAHDVQPSRPAKTREFGAPARPERGGEMVRFRVNQGKRDYLHPAKLVSVMCSMGGITGGQIGAIRIERDHTTFEVQADAAKGFFKQVQQMPLGKFRVEAAPLATFSRPAKPYKGGFAGKGKAKAWR